MLRLATTVLVLASGAAAQACFTPTAYGMPPQSGNITASLQKDCYLLTASAGDLVRITYVSDSSLAAEVDVLDPTGMSVGTGSWKNSQLDLQLSAAGLYRLYFRSYNLSTTGRYWFSVQRLNDPVGASPTCYEIVEHGSVDSPAETDCYTFMGTKDKVVGLNKTPSGGNIAAELLDPSGARVCFVNWNQSVASCTLPATGRYTVIVRGYNNSATGSYQVRIACVSFPCECTASWRNFGQGWPGTSGQPPSLTASAQPKMGTLMSIDVGNSAGVPTTGWLLLGFQRTDMATIYGGNVLVIPDVVAPLSIPTTGAKLPLLVPNQPFFCGICQLMQAIELDAGASNGVSFSRGCEVVIGQ